MDERWGPGGERGGGERKRDTRGFIVVVKHIIRLFRSIFTFSKKYSIVVNHIDAVYLHMRYTENTRNVFLCKTLIFLAARIDTICR